MKQQGIWIHGCTGRTGSLIFDHFKNDLTGAFQFCGGSNAKSLIDSQGLKIPYKNSIQLAQCFADRNINAVIDFSTLDANRALLDAIAHDSSKVDTLLIGTTGLGSEDVNRWRNLAALKSIRILVAPNTSLGVLAMAQAASVIRQVLKHADFDVELVETHHRQKLDAPGGTAKYLAQVVAKASPDESLTIVTGRESKRKAGELGVHAVRGGHVVGKHELSFFGEYEELTISHVACDRRLFARGAHTLLNWLITQKPGFFGLDDVDFTKPNAIVP